MQKPVKSGPLWNKLPQLLNLARYRMLSRQQDSVLDYEPLHLSINPLECHVHWASSQTLDESGKRIQLDMETFRFLLEQVPTIRTIEFSCREADPLAMPDLFQLVDYAFRFNGAESTIVTEGWHLASRLSEILSSRLTKLVIPLAAHRPSQYSRMTGRPLQQFVTLKSMIEELAQRKKTENPRLEIELVMRVDVHNYLEIPHMMQFAKNLGCNGIQFENFHSPSLDPKEERTIFSDYRSIIRYLEGLAEIVIPESGLHVSLPIPLERELKENRNCLDAYSTVSVDSELNVSGCSRQLLAHDHQGKIWEEDFFNNPMYQWMRSIHCKDTANGQPLPMIPMACQQCPHNLP